MSPVGQIISEELLRMETTRPNVPLDAWVPRFHERLIRNEDHLEATRRYVANNPRKWRTPACPRVLRGRGNPAA